jgi:flagellar protein FliO/FliZ
MKRYASGASSRTGLMRVVGQMALGPHERVSIVEIDGQWLILGVTAHQVTILTHMPARAEPEKAVPSTEFSKLLARLRGKRDAS